MDTLPPWQWLLFGAVLGFVVARLLRGGRAGQPRPPAPPDRPLSPDTVNRVRELAMTGRTIDAIRAYREATGAGLREAKDYVDALRRVRH